MLPCRDTERRPSGKGLVRRGELVLDVDPKTQRVLLKKKVGMAIPPQTHRLWSAQRCQQGPPGQSCFCLDSGLVFISNWSTAGAGTREALPAVEDERFRDAVSRGLVPPAEQTSAAAAHRLLAGAGHRWAGGRQRQQVSSDNGSVRTGKVLAESETVGHLEPAFMLCCPSVVKTPLLPEARVTGGTGSPGSPGSPA